MDEAFLMIVGEVFRIPAKGTVVTGRIAEGSIRPGDEVQVSGAGRATVVTVEQFRNILDIGRAGQDVALLLDGEAAATVRKGDTVAAARTARATETQAPAPSASPPTSTTTRERKRSNPGQRPADAQRPVAAQRPAAAGRPAAARPQPAPAAHAYADKRFTEAESKYTQLRDALASGRITARDLDAELSRNVFPFAGRYWMIGANSGKWYASEGTQWVEKDPPRAAGKKS